MVQFRKSEQQRRINQKCELLDQYSTSEQLFDQLISEIETLRNDEHSHDLSVGDEYNYGVEYEVELIMELISDLRWFTRFIKEDDDKSINEFNLNYIRPYWN